MFGKTFFVMPTPWCWGLEGVKKKRMSLCGILSGIGFAAAFFIRAFIRMGGAGGPACRPD